ncbi:MAG: SagB/ThcOx family dehydrogenase [Bacteroidales bacterium]
MKTKIIIIMLASIAGIGFIGHFGLRQPLEKEEMGGSVHLSMSDKIVELPEPDYQSNRSLEKVLLQRRSRREYKDKALSLSEISQLLWAAQGITDDQHGFRTSPSAGALYPLEIYVVATDVENLENGVYEFIVDSHSLKKIKTGEYNEKLASAALGQSCIEKASAIFVISAVYERTTQKYGDRGIRYVHMEAGHAAQNVYLQSTAFDIGTVTIGAFDDENVKQVVGMADNETALYIMPIGKI